MSYKPLIKICGVRSPEVAQSAIALGADWIGMVFHPLSVRHISIADAMRINQAVIGQHKKAIGVFVEQNAQEISEICEKIGIDCVQLHGVLSKQESVKLPEHLARILVLRIDSAGHLLQEDLNYLPNLNRVRDYVLLDYLEGGSGRETQYQNAFGMSVLQGFRILIAGGLNAKNVGTPIKTYHPFGVDVSSGVETEPGKKDVNLIKDFIGAVCQAV